MTPEDVARIEDEVNKAKALADRVVSGQSKADIISAKKEVNSAITAIEGLSTFYDSVVKRYQGLRDGADDKKRSLNRTLESLKDAYFLLREEQMRDQEN